MKLKKRYIIPLSLLILGFLAFKIWTYKPSNFTRSDSNGIEYKCDRGYVTVPELRADPQSNKVQIEYVRIRSKAKNPKAPIFYLDGGPGFGSTGQADNPGYLNFWSSFLEERDVVLIDQRGVGKLKMWYVRLKWPHEDLFVTEAAATNHLEEMSHRAKRAFARRGIDLNGYNSKESAHDIDTVRDLLGYDKIVTFGFSYGTHLGQTYLKYHEDRVEKAILIGVEGLDETFKMPLDLDNHIEKINALIQQDSTLAVAIPDLRQLYQSVVANLEKQPVVVEINTPVKLKRKVKLGKFGLDFILKRDLGDASDIPILPKMLYQMSKGDYSTLQWYVQKRYKRFLAIPAMNFSMDISSGGSAERIARIRDQETKSLFGKINNFPYLDLYGTWPVKDLGEEFREPVESSVPILLLSGDLDINTPAYQAERASQYLSKSTHLVVKNAGHEQIMYLWDSIKAMNEFLNGHDVSDMKLSYPPIKFKSM